MRYLLDTNACIRYLKSNPGVVDRVRQAGVATLAICAPVKAELWFGACKSENPLRNQERITRFFGDLTSLPFDDTAAQRCGEVRADLSHQGILIGPYDLQIAAIAPVNDLTLVSNNLKEFQRISGLRVEDWQS